VNAARRLARLEAGPLGAPRRESQEFADLMMARGVELRHLRKAGRAEPYEKLSDMDLIVEWSGRSVPRAHLEEIVRRYEEPSEDIERQALRLILDTLLRRQEGG
jgi:hypothetical protein